MEIIPFFVISSKARYTEALPAFMASAAFFLLKSKEMPCLSCLEIKYEASLSSTFCPEKVIIFLFKKSILSTQKVMIFFEISGCFSMRKFMESSVKKTMEEFFLAYISEGNSLEENTARIPKLSYFESVFMHTEVPSERV